MPLFRNKLVILKDLFPFPAFFRNKSSLALDKTQAPCDEDLYGGVKFWDDSDLEGHRKLTDAIHAAFFDSFGFKVN